MQPPAFFETTRKAAAQRWSQLEADPDLAAPWHQLFRQVQSPRHVVSELLQNADDAGATAATVEIKDGDFVFSHNGEDFREEHFVSLCRFGYSNKRALHTIGFRGIGFKSTFSLGDEVRLRTPTLSVCFNRQRFTEPQWQNAPQLKTALTEVRVTIKDAHRQRELEKNLQEWLTSATSLLFFRNIRCLRIGEQEVKWVSKGNGPLPDSEWMVRSNAPDERFLLIRSVEEDFPAEAVEEIKQERMISIKEETPLPPCRVELVLGLEGRLFVILPTGVKTNLPFACNAPFVQDPARVKIKDPETSPTNRWLLQRAGRLAADAMLAWLNQTASSAEERSGAYDLFSDVDRDDNSLEGVCAAICETAFDESLEGKSFLLTEDYQLRPWEGCITVPGKLLEIWKPDQVATFFDDEARPILSRHVSAKNRKKLIHWGCVSEIEDSNVLGTLESKHLPKPETWRQLLLLWAHVSEDIAGRYSFNQHQGARIVPVQGQDVLYAANEVVRLGEKRLLQSEEDWEFLAKCLFVLNQNWPRFLAEQRRKAEEQDDEDLGADVEAAFRVLQALKLTDASDVSRVVQQVAESFFSADGCELEDCVRLAHIAANLGATLADSFQFVTRDDCRTHVTDSILYDERNDLDQFLPQKWYEDHALDEAYYREFKSCTKDTWREWVASGKSRLLTFAPLQKTQTSIWERSKLREALRERNPACDPYFPYVTNQFFLDDWDFTDEMWRHWRAAAREDKDFWGRLFTRIIQQPQAFWNKSASAQAYQVATTGNSQRVTTDPLVASWMLKFRRLPCIQDTRGAYRIPTELLRRTPETESLLDVEPFVRAELDTEATRPLLKLLGVGDKPTGPDSLLSRLRALATVANPPSYEVEKLYNRLDQLFDNCSTMDAQKLRQAFDDEKLILTDGGAWARAVEVFVAADEEDVPGAALVHPAVRHLSLWRKVGVAERPTAERVMDWLALLESGSPLSPDEIRRVRSLLPRYPERIWNECQHWLNLEGEWIAVSELKYSLTMQGLVAWKHLFRPIKRQTADLQKLSAEVCQQSPFSDLHSLADCIEDRIQDQLFDPDEAQQKRWLISLGRCLSRVVLESEDETSRVRDLARRLAKTVWQVTTTLETVPYIDGTPVGTSRQIPVLWQDECLFVENRSTAKVAKDVAQELGRVFGRQEITDAIKLCYDRPDEFIIEYAEENFELAPAEEIELPDEEVKKEESLRASGTDSVKDDKDAEVVTVPDNTANNDNESPETIALTDDEQEPSDEQHDDGDEVLDDEEDDDEPVAVPVKRPAIAKPSLMERFAASQGFRKDGAERFYHADGSWIEKVSGSAFPWERRDASSELVRCYWPKEHCIQHEPLQIAAEVWEACRRQPNLYALLLTTEDERPVEIIGKRLLDMVSQEQLVLHPAAYRLVYQEQVIQAQATA